MAPTKGGAEVGNPIDLFSRSSAARWRRYCSKPTIPNVADEMERHAAAIGGYVGERIFTNIAAQLRSGARRYAEATAE